MRAIIIIFISLLGISVFAKDHLVSGYAHNCHLKETTNVMTCWGWNHHGQLGQGHTHDASGPKRVNLPPGKIKDIDTGSGITCAIVDEDLYCWGENGHGELGLGDYKDRYTPVKVRLPGKVTQVSAGYYHICATVDGGAMCWGFNYSCQIGQKNCKGGNDNPFMSWNKPRWVMGMPAGSGVTHVEAGKSTSCAIKKGGLFCWGAAFLGQLGDGNRKIEYRPKPQVVPGHNEGSGVREVVIGDLHSCVNRNGMIRCWGVSDFLGIGEGHKVLKPTVPSNVFGNPWPHLSTFDGTSCVTRRGKAYCWGDAVWGALGTGEDEPFGEFLMPVANLKNITALSTGSGHSCAISDGHVYCWGWNGFCQLGVGKCGDEYFNSFGPQPVVGL